MSEFTDEIVDASVPQGQGLKYLAHWPPVNIGFEDIIYTVENGLAEKNSSMILRSLSGSFKSGQLIAIMGPSGAGKTTLLNILAGFKCDNVSGNVLINKKDRDMKTFCHMSRYIMQQDIYQEGLTVKEVMMFAADFKLGFNDLTQEQKVEVVDEILHLLRLTKAKDTDCSKLSGGEKKRLSIAQELLNNPPVLFLDEPTSGLDELSGSQCMELLRKLAHGGRTVICSIHTPSAKIFEMFDHIYVVNRGQCIFQGRGENIVPFMETIGIRCPKTYHPSDFIIEVASGEYGREFPDRMVACIDNGRVTNWKPSSNTQDRYKKIYNFTNSNVHDFDEFHHFDEEVNPSNLKFKCSSWQQFSILFRRVSKQIYRNKSYLYIRIYMHIFLGFVIGGLFYQMGNDATKTMFNFGFCFTIVIAFLYIPMLPMLLEFPTQVQQLKREYFNRWYRCNPYFFATILAKLPIQILNSFLYLTMVYLITDQPIEAHRIALFYLVSILTSLTSESFGLLISSRLSIINGVFVGPVCAVPMMLLSVYGIGSGKDSIPKIVQFIMSLSYLRYALEGIIQSIYGFNRGDMNCPPDEIYCPYKKPEFLLRIMGFEDTDVRVSIVALIVFYLTFNTLALLLIRNRLSKKKTSIWPINLVSRVVKSYFNLTPG